jgi:hypothetical protein
MKLKNDQLFAIFVVELLFVLLSGCNAASSPSSPLTVRWTTVAMEVNTTISSQTKRQDHIELKLYGVSDTESKPQSVVAAVSHSSFELRILKNKLLHNWMYRDYTPIMIVTDKSMFEHNVSYIKSNRNGVRQAHSLVPRYVPIHGTSRKLWWMMVPVSFSSDDAVISISFVQKHSNPKGYFTAFRIWRNSNLRHVSGCAKVAKNIPYTEDSGEGMEVTPYHGAGHGFHGWCYTSLDLAGHPPIGYGYFSVSTATAWRQIAEWTNKQFIRVQGATSQALPRIVRELKLKSNMITDKEKIISIRTWMTTNLRYSVFESKKAGIPNNFDTVIHNRGGDCTDLTLVMVTLIRAAGIDAHPAITSMTLRYPFRHSPANLPAINHVVIYLPRYHHFIDATAKSEQDQSYLAIQDVMDVVTGKVLDPTKEQVSYFR